MARPRRVTLRDISADTGLSVAAVSYALRGLHVPHETQVRVRESARRLDYQVDPIARALASGRTGHVGLLCRSLADLWQQSLAATLGRALLATDRLALIADSGDDPALEARLARQLVDQRVDALIVLPVDAAAAHWAEIAGECVLVSVGDPITEARTYGAVTFDNETPVRQALADLISLGHRHIAVLTPISGAIPDRAAERAVRKVASEVEASISLVTCASDLPGAAAVASDLLATPDRPTAFLCLADSMAYGVYVAARERGLEVPGDVSVMGNDDNPVSGLLNPPLSTWQWPMPDVVDALVGACVRGIDEGEPSRDVVIRPHPRARGSVAVAPDRR